MTNREQLAALVASGGNCVNLGRQLKARNQELWNWVLTATAFLDGRISSDPVRDTERFYCILNGITAVPLNASGEPAKYTNLFRGYSTGEKRAAKQKQAATKAATKQAAKAAQPLKPAPRTKIEEYIARNRKRNAHLYSGPALVENIDYVVCPVTGERRTMITEPYVTKVLGMTMEQFTAMYPDAVLMSQARVQNVKAGLQEIDSETGLTKHELSKKKSTATLSAIDPETGLRGYDKIGQKTRATHMSNVDEFGRNGYQRQVHGRLTTVLDNGLTVEQNAHIKQRQTMMQTFSTGTGGASRQSIKVLKPLLEFLDQNKVKYYFDKQEYCILCPDSQNYYFSDLAIPDFKLVIEYQSKAWHADPALTDEEWNNWKPPRGVAKTAKEVLDYDYNKARSLYKHRGMVTYYVWQRTEKTDIEEILCLLKTMIMKS